MKKGKILGLDGLTVEFYLGFYDLIKYYMLNAIRESQKFGKVLWSINSTHISFIQKNQAPSSLDNFCLVAC